jgi:hypothetical protein
VAALRAQLADQEKQRLAQEKKLAEIEKKKLNHLKKPTLMTQNLLIIFKSLLLKSRLFW